MTDYEWRDLDLAGFVRDEYIAKLSRVPDGAERQAEIQRMRLALAELDAALLGAVLSRWGIPFVSAKVTRHSHGNHGDIVCETKEQCVAIHTRALDEDWETATGVSSWHIWAQVAT